MKKKKALRLKKDGTVSGNLIPGHEGAELDAVMFDPGEQHLDLTKAEKLRTTALLMAINYVRETICNDAEMYRALRQDGKELVPASVPWVLQCSIDFELFLLGYYTRHNVAMVKKGAEMEQKRAAVNAGTAEPSESATKVDAVDPVGETVTS